MLEVFPTAGIQLPDARAFRDFDPLRLNPDLTYPCNPCTINSTWQAPNITGSDRKQQLKILTAV